MENRMYLAIDLKSFYASVECVERGLDPITTNLVVADQSRTEKTICLAVSPSLKSYGISGRPRLFEVSQKVKEVNRKRRQQAPDKKLAGASYLDTELKENPQMAVDYIVAPPRMAKYLEISARIYSIYLKYIAPEDIHVYSIDEVFMDITQYQKTYQLTARDLAMKMIRNVLEETGITATAGIGSNLYLCKVAMDLEAKHISADLTARDLAMKMIRNVLEETGITATAGIGSNLYLCKVAMDLEAKHISADRYGVRIAELDEMTYRKKLWTHRPLTDFWRVGHGYAKKLEEHGLYTMGDIARCSLGTVTDYYNEDLLYRLFGVNAELLIDHAWGWEPCTMADIKAYRPQSNSISSGQVLQCPYPFEKARLVVHEMVDQMALDLVDKGLVTNQIILTVGYDIENLSGGKDRKKYQGVVTTDRYGRDLPRHAHGTVNLDGYTSSSRRMADAVLSLFDQIVNSNLLIRRLTIAANHVVEETSVVKQAQYHQLELFADPAEEEARLNKEHAQLEREKRMQETMLSIKKKYGKNAILKGMNLQEGATAKTRNRQIGGHKA